MRTSIPKNNFSSGQIDRDVKGRVDLPIFQNGNEISRNFFHTIKGDCYYRTGFEFIDEISNAALYEFKFSQEQAYLLVFTTENIDFYSYNASGQFVRVLDSDAEPLSVSHSWGSDVFNLSITQNCDVLYIDHNSGQYPEYKLTRTASNAFTLSTTTYTNTGTASLSSSSPTENHGYPCSCAFYENRLNRCSSTNYPTYLYGSKGADYDNITVGTGTNDGYQFDLSEANSKALWLMSGVNSLLVGTAEGILTVNGGSVTSAITPSDISAKLSCREGVSSVKPIHKDNYVFFVSSNNRQVYMFEYDVLLEQFKATNLSKANYEITKGGIKKLANKYDRFGLIFALCGTKLISICFSNDEAVNSWSEYITDGEFIDICSVTRPDGNCDLFANIKRTINGTTKYYLERLTEAVEFSRFEDFISDIPKNSTAQEVLEIKKQDKYAYFRQVAEELRECNHLDCSIKYSGLQNTSITFNEETNIITVNETEYVEELYDSTYTDAEISNGFIKITLPDYMIGKNGAKSDIVGIYNTSYVNNLNGLRVGANLYKVVNKEIYNGKYTNYQTSGTWRSITFTNSFKIFNNTTNANILYFQGTMGVNKELYANPYGAGYIYVGKVTAINTTKKTITINADILTPSENYYMGEVLTLDTNEKEISVGYYKNAFKSSDVGKRIWYKTVTGREYGIFDIKEFIDNYNVKVTKVLEPTSNSCDSWYLSATYFTGLEHLEGKTVSVVGNGGYIGDYVVTNGEIDISNANVNKVGTAIIGLKYKGILKSPNLGLLLQGTQTFSNMKNIYKIGLQLCFSAGTKVGSNLYDLQNVQEFNPEGLYDVPPLPMDEYKEVLYEDDYDREKHYFVVQDSPLPLHITAIIPHYKHVSRT